jgi:hypothetical protein
MAGVSGEAGLVCLHSGLSLHKDNSCNHRAIVRGESNFVELLATAKRKPKTKKRCHKFNVVNAAEHTHREHYSLESHQDSFLVSKLSCVVFFLFLDLLFHFFLILYIYIFFPRLVFLAAMLTHFNTGVS